MADPFDKLKAKFYSDYPGDDFWEYVKRNVRGLENITSDTYARQQLDNAYNIYNALSPAQKAPFSTSQLDYSGALGGRGPMIPYQNMFLQEVRAMYERDVASGGATQEEADNAYNMIAQQVLTEGLHSGIPLINRSMAFENFKNEISNFGIKVDIPGGGSAYQYGNVYFNTDGTYMPATQQMEIQRRIDEQNKKIEDAERSFWAAETESGKWGAGKTTAGTTGTYPLTSKSDYKDFQKRWAATPQGTHVIDPARGQEGRSGVDIAVAPNAAAAREMGYVNFIPESTYRSPGFRGVFIEELYRNLYALTAKFDLPGSVKPEGVSGADVVTASPLQRIRWLSESEQQAARDTAAFTAMEATGTTPTTAGVKVRDERSPLWHTNAQGERVQGAWVMTSEEWLGSAKRKHRNAMIAAAARARAKKRAELEASYGKYVTPEGVTGAWVGGGKGGREDPNIDKYELKGENVPAWATQYIPGLTAGENLRLGHYIQPFSGQQMQQMLPSQKDWISQYADVSRQVLGEQIPLMPGQDLFAYSQIGTPGSWMPTTSWKPRKQRA